MKKLHFVLMLAAAFVAASCTGTLPTDDQGNEPEKVKLLKNVVFQMLDSDGEIMEIETESFTYIYDKEDRLSSVLAEDYSETLVYSNNKVTITHTYFQSNSTTKTECLFDNGLLIKHEGITYTYNDDSERPQCRVIEWGSESTTYNYIWDKDGNLLQVKWQSPYNDKTETNSFTYTDIVDKCNIQVTDLIYDNFSVLCFDKNVFHSIANKHLIKSSTEQGYVHKNWSYKFDDDGYPIEMRCDVKVDADAEAGLDEEKYSFVLKLLYY